VRLFSKQCQAVVFLLMTSSFAAAQTNTLSPQQAATMSSDNKAIIVDVREDDEWNAHHIPGAIHIPLGQLNERLTELEPYKNSPVITQCRSGKRSAKAQLALMSAGFSKVYTMNGGIQAWDEQGLATE